MKETNGKFKKLRAFIVGINAYEHVSPLETPVNDGTDLANELKETFGYEVDKCFDPDKKALLGFLAKMEKKVEADDCVLFYFAGHGFARDEKEGLKGFVLATDADMNKYKTLIPMQELFDAFSALPCRHFLLVLDCCFSGAFRWAEKLKHVSNRTKARMSRQHYEHYTTQPAWQVITSATHTQKSYDLLGGRADEGVHNSPFAQLMLKGLAGKADWNRDKIITASELSTYLGDRLRVITSVNSQQGQSVVFFPLPKHGNGEFIFQPASFDAQELKAKHYKNPYMGLEAYTEDTLFFGRSEAIKALKVVVKDNKFIVVIGASGTGKSSLVKAGILPEIKKKQVVHEMRPGKFPLSIFNEIDPFCEVLFIDQFEEVLTQSTKDEAEGFLQQLKQKIAEGELTIILTLRIDLESQIDISGIEKEWKSGRFIVPPFTPENLREVIITPAARVGRFIESDKLVDDILNEVVHYPGSMPLLSFTLSGLFEKCGEDPYRGIRESDYQALGGVIGALKKSADNIYYGLGEEERDTFRCIILRMVSIVGGEFAGQRVFTDDLVFESPDVNMQVEKVINILAKARLIQSNQDGNLMAYIEPTHDAIFRSWPMVYNWINDLGIENQVLFHRLYKAVSDHEHVDGGLWTNDMGIFTINEYMKNKSPLFNLKERKFIKKSFEASREQSSNVSALLFCVLFGPILLNKGLSVFEYLACMGGVLILYRIYHNKVGWEHFWQGFFFKAGKKITA